MHLYGTCPSIIRRHSTLDVTHTLGQVRAKILCSNPIPMCNHCPSCTDPPKAITGRVFPNCERHAQVPTNIQYGGNLHRETLGVL